MAQRFFVNKAEIIFSGDVGRPVLVFTFIIDVETDSNFYPLVGAAKYMTPAQTQSYSDALGNITGIRILSIVVFDKDANVLVEEQWIPNDEFWYCSLAFAKNNYWI
jgi:hypothetical protein